MVGQRKKDRESWGVAIKRCTKLGKRANLLMKHKPEEAVFFPMIMTQYKLFSSVYTWSVCHCVFGKPVLFSLMNIVCLCLSFCLCIHKTFLQCVS